MSLDTFLTTIMRQGYIDRFALGGDPSKKQGAKRGRATQAADDDGGATYEWRWGNRASCEISEVSIAKFVAELMTSNTGADDDGGAANKAKRMFDGIAKAAGGTLSDLK
jgi:melanoma-associated antigen